MSGPDSAPPADPGPEPTDTLFPPDHAVTSLFGRGSVDWPATEKQAAELFPEQPPARSAPPPAEPEAQPAPAPAPIASAEPATEADPDPEPERPAVTAPQ